MVYALSGILPKNIAIKSYLLQPDVLTRAKDRNRILVSIRQYNLPSYQFQLLKMSERYISMSNLHIFFVLNRKLLKSYMSERKILSMDYLNLERKVYHN